MQQLIDRMTAARYPWTSNALKGWYPPDVLRANLRTSMVAEAGRIGSATFGREFIHNVATVDVGDPLAWANRFVELQDSQWCIAGIRFRGRDLTKPFVDVVATSMPPTADGLANICRAVVPLYTDFHPRAVRVDAPEPDALVAQLLKDSRFTSAKVDQYVVAGLVSDIVARSTPGNAGRVSIASTTVERASTGTMQFYGQVEAAEPELRSWATPSSQEELSECAEQQLLFEILVNDQLAGIAAARRDDDHSMTGFVMQEIVLSNHYRGHRLSSPVLHRLSIQLPAQDGDTLWGTIHPDNQPSLRNALSVGRQIVGGYVWVTPRGLPGL